MQKTVTGLTQRIIRTKHALFDDLQKELGELSEPDWVINQLIALTMLQESTMQDLLDLYLSSRKVSNNSAIFIYFSIFFRNQFLAFRISSNPWLKHLFRYSLLWMRLRLLLSLFISFLYKEIWIEHCKEYLLHIIVPVRFQLFIIIINESYIQLYS